MPRCVQRFDICAAQEEERERIAVVIRRRSVQRRVAAFLAKAVDPPSAMAVKNALELLMAIGALTSDERLTKLGWRLGALPVDPRLGKMLLLASLLGCVDPMVSFLLFTVTFYANHAHNLTRSP